MYEFDKVNLKIDIIKKTRDRKSDLLYISKINYHPGLGGVLLTAALFCGFNKINVPIAVSPAYLPSFLRACFLDIFFCVLFFFKIFNLI